MKKSLIRTLKVGTLCIGLIGVAGIASAGDWPLSGIFRPLVHAPVRVVIGVPICPAPVYVAPYRERIVVPEIVIHRDRYDHRDRFDRRRDWR
jgi:hypothetical protein